VKIGGGANGVVHQLASYRLPEVPGPIVFKHYFQRKGTEPPAAAGLAGIVQTGTTITDKEQRRAITERTAWPLRVVLDDDHKAVGVLMRLIPDEFMQRFAQSRGRTKIRPREIQHLMMDPAVIRHNGVDVPADNRMRARGEICRELAYVMAALRGAGLIFGDVSARNILYSIRPRPSIFFVDCDAARVHGSASVFPQQHSPDWEPPEAMSGTSDKQNHATDNYKLALAIMRILTPGRGSSVNRDRHAADRVLGAEGRLLLKRALEGKPPERPEAKEWFRYFTNALGKGGPTGRSADRGR
jgi:DNA-binding helix-hairpin-helix protein with protein kinase domain